MLYEMLTGVIAFTHDDSSVIMEARVTGDPEPLRKLNSRVSPQAEEIVLRAMERNPDLRYSTAAAMKADLDGPTEVAVTGRWERLEVSTPRKRRLRQIRSVILWVLVPVAIQIILFLAIWRYLAAK
jgi:serine/threonine protein kinase